MYYQQLTAQTDDHSILLFIANFRKPLEFSKVKNDNNNNLAYMAPVYRKTLEMLEEVRPTGNRTCNLQAGGLAAQPLHYGSFGRTKANNDN